MFFVTLLPRETGALSDSQPVFSPGLPSLGGLCTEAPASEEHFFVPCFYPLSQSIKLNLNDQMTASPIIDVFIAGLTRAS